MSGLRKFGDQFWLTLTVVVAMPLAAGYFGHLHRALDSFAHFRVHLALLLALAALPLFATRFLKIGAIAIFGAILSFASTSGSVPLPLLGMQYGPLYQKIDGAPVYRLLQLNLRFDNRQKEKVLSLIGRVQPDVVTLNEIKADWVERLKALSAAYPYGIVCPFPNGLWGAALLSRRPLAEGTVPFCDQRGAFAVATVDFGGRQAQIAAVHLGWPWPYEQAWQIGGLARYFGELGDTAILAGDFNATPWSYAVKRVAEAGKLMLMPSPGPTWLDRRLPRFLNFAGLPIDQVMAKGDILVHSVRTLDDVGSDHWPVLVEFSFKPKPRGPGENATALAALSKSGARPEGATSAGPF